MTNKYIRETFGDEIRKRGSCWGSSLFAKKVDTKVDTQKKKAPKKALFRELMTGIGLFWGSFCRSQAFTVFCPWAQYFPDVLIPFFGIADPLYKTKNSYINLKSWHESWHDIAARLPWNCYRIAIKLPRKKAPECHNDISGAYDHWLSFSRVSGPHIPSQNTLDW